MNIDLDGFEGRAVVLPPPAGNYSGLQAVKGKLLFQRQPRSGSADTKSPIVYFDLTEREEKPVLEDAGGFEVTADGKKMLVAFQGRFAILEIKSPQKFEKPIATADMEAPVDPRAEWKQMFEDVYRFQRDFFYDKGMHGVDWAAMKARYGKLLDDAVTRWDVDFIIGEFIGELNASHTYYSGGEKENAPARNVGMLGVDWELHQPATGSGGLSREEDRPRWTLGCRLCARRSTTGRERQAKGTTSSRSTASPSTRSRIHTPPSRAWATRPSC